MYRVLTLAAFVAVILLVPATAGAQRAATRVTVTASDFKYVLSKQVVPKGAATFVVKNVGAVPHDFKIAGKRTAMLAPGASATLNVTFAKGGKFPYVCTLAGHAEAGMKGVLPVR
jgi:uncharacterized cupredoxin-like copper-binding protein